MTKIKSIINEIFVCRKVLAIQYSTLLMGLHKRMDRPMGCMPALFADLQSTLASQV